VNNNTEIGKKMEDAHVLKWKKESTEGIKKEKREENNKGH